MKRRWPIVLLIVLIVGLCAASYTALHWRDFGQRHAETGSASSRQSSGYAVPNRDEAIALISGTMKSFAQALVQKDFTDFYGTFSALWKKQTTPVALSQAFKAFLPFGREVQKSVTSEDPFINAPPSIGEKNVLTLQGYYRIEATKMLFNLQYIREGDAWKLFGMNLEVK